MSSSSTTYATLTAGNINIGGKETTVEELGIHSDINSANQKVDDVPDLQAILDKQKIVSDATSTIVAAGRTYSQNQVKAATEKTIALAKEFYDQLSPEDQEKFNTFETTEKEAYLSKNISGYADALANQKAVTATWGIGGNGSRAVNAVTTALTAVLGGQTDLQTVTNTLAPYAAQVIGQEFGHGEDKNTAAQMVAHALLGATLAYINGGDPTAGGSAVVASEAAAMYFTNQYKDKKEYQDANGEFQPNLLPEDVKAQIRDLTAGIGAVIGGAVGDSSYNAQLAGVIGQNAVENNSLLGDDVREKLKETVKWVVSKTDIPIAQGVINGVGSIGDGILAIADAFGDTAVSAIHCPLGTSACADAMENNRKKGQAIIDFLTINNLKKQAAAIEQSYKDLASGDPVKVANAQRVQAEVFTSLGLSAASIKKLGTNNVSNIPKLNWSTGWAARGLQWEATLKQSLSSNFIDLNSFKTNFKTFDFYDPSTQTAISAKSMDTISSFNGTNGLKSLEKQMKGYINDTLAFKRDAQKGGGPFVLTKDKIKNREVQIAIPEGTSKAKMQVIKNMVDYGKQNNVKVIVTVTKSGK